MTSPSSTVAWYFHCKLLNMYIFRIWQCWRDFFSPTIIQALCVKSAHGNTYHLSRLNGSNCKDHKSKGFSSIKRLLVERICNWYCSMDHACMLVLLKVWHHTDKKSLYNEMKMSSLWLNFHHWPHQKLSKWNRNVVILTFLPLFASEVVILTTSDAANNDNLIKMTTFPFQCTNMVTYFTVIHLCH